jgi:recombination protein RecT
MANELATINPKTIFSELQKMKPQIEAALPRHMTPDRMARIALTQLRVNKKLFNCTAESFYASLMAASQLGLEPGVQGQCYLIPYGTTCTLVPGWRGYMDLVSRTERATAWTDAVYDGDEFDYEKGDKPFIHHKPGKWAGKEAALIFTYAVGRTKSSEWPVIEVWDIDKVWAHRNKQNKVGDRHYSYVHPEMYARKIPLLQVIKYLPSSIELANASALDVTASEGRQNLTIDMALKGELDSGGDASEFDPNDPDEQELEEMFDKLGKNATERKMLRESYIPQGRRKELIEYLRGRLAPTGQTITVSTQAKEQASQAEVSTEQAKGEPAQETEEKKKRGRPKGSTKTQVEPDTQLETQSQPEQAEQEEKPAQQAKSEAGKFQF